MAQEFSKVVEDVKQLSIAEKEELQELLKSYLASKASPNCKRSVEASRFADSRISSYEVMPKV